jgi:hypothetical protein
MNDENAQRRETETTPEDASRLLLTFLQGRDARCPECGYNLRDLTQTQCPECSQRLQLMVGHDRLEIGLLLITITPSIFSGICAILLTMVIYIEPGAPWEAILLDLFGLTSGLFGVGLFLFRERFVRQRRSVQKGWAFLTWTIHVGAFFVLWASVN